ncbi:hypothetical protein HK098_007867 [Nowakowskiella sp. JEL0407]|nr:hypothetical protein HK098_007867 [Nowakowskiella sp. JEL0407]
MLTNTTSTTPTTDETQLIGRSRYFPSHQSSFLRHLKTSGLSQIDLIIEVRDARIPFSSVNPELWNGVIGKSVYASAVDFFQWGGEEGEFVLKDGEKEGNDGERSGGGGEEGEGGKEGDGKKTWKELVGREDQTGFEKLGRHWCVVYNKRDLANHNLFKDIEFNFKRYINIPTFFTTASKNEFIKPILRYAMKIQSDNPTRYPYINILVIGMPNVGKSSIINALRTLASKRKTAQVAPQAGVTKRIQNRVKIWDEPRIYVIDTPGIVDPHIIDPLQYLKIALVGGIPDSAVEVDEVADYLLFLLNKRKDYEENAKLLGLDAPSNDIQYVLSKIAIRKGYFMGPPKYVASLSLEEKQRNLDLTRAGWDMIRMFRDGKFGRMTLDEIGKEELKEWVEKWSALRDTKRRRR